MDLLGVSQPRVAQLKAEGRLKCAGRDGRSDLFEEGSVVRCWYWMNPEHEGIRGTGAVHRGGRFFSVDECNARKVPKLICQAPEALNGGLSSP